MTPDGNRLIGKKSMVKCIRPALGVWLLVWGSMGGPVLAAKVLDAELARQEIGDLASKARVLGDPDRGAVLFYRVGLGCTQCHTAGEGERLLGPDLSMMSERATYDHVIESLLEPSKVVQERYQNEKLLLASGQVLVGMIREESSQHIKLAIPGEETLRVIASEEIEVRASAPSIMPTGLINQLSGEEEFFDLVSFLVELGQAGPTQAYRLRPEAALLAPQPLPAYELDLNHVGMIQSWNSKSLARGKAIYNSLCVNCHGTVDEPGSLPNALRFASGKFRSGADPYSMYKTLTHGFGMMLPQPQLVPQQKYDVIHFIREAYLKPHQPSQYTLVDTAYLASLPKGSSRGPVAMRQEPWREMDYGPFLISSYELVGAESPPRPEVTAADRERAAIEGRPAERTWPADTNFAYKGIAVQLDSAPGGIAEGSHWITFDHDTLRIAGAWTGKGFIDWNGILFDGQHFRTPRTVGTLQFANPPGPGWADPATGSFDDPRFLARDGQRYGPLPSEWGKYHGLYKHGQRIVIAYRVGQAEILESHRFDASEHAWVRILNLSQSPHDLTLRIAPESALAVSVNGPTGLRVEISRGYSVLKIPADQTPVNFELRMLPPQVVAAHEATQPRAPEDLQRFTTGGDAQWAEDLNTTPDVGGNRTAFVYDTLTRPTGNPWKSRLRMSGLDFFPDGKRMVACCCDGDVWIIDGIDKVGGDLTWRRIASGLFHPLGIKIVHGRILVSCRDQIVVLNDLNGDGETDFYECLNNDHQVTEHFHEFAMGLQADEAGNLYYAKSARHARDSLVPQHGTLLKVSADGSETTILANGFRAANGVCLNPDDTFFVTDQEGHWTPMNRINRVTQGGFYGNMYSYGAPSDTSDAAMQWPLCWPNKPFDRSPSELVWVDSEPWGPLKGSLLSLSYGYGRIFIVPHEQVDGWWQGGMCQLPLPDFPTGLMRARFHPRSGHLYVCGMQAWGSSQIESPGGLYRVRMTGKPANLPIGLHAHQQGLTITFSDPVDVTSATDPGNYYLESWALKRTANYGSDRYEEAVLSVASVELSSDLRQVTLRIDGIKPTWTMQIAYKLRDVAGERFQGVIQNTIHRLGGESSSPKSTGP